MKKLLLLSLALNFIMTNQIFAQNERCGTMALYEKHAIEHPELIQKRIEDEIELQKRIALNQSLQKRSNPYITIPVVVHVLYNDASENISEAQINSQMDILNQDFRLLNPDSLQPSHPFWIHTADCGIEFCLASVDPNGNPTNGITRTFTDSTAFAGIGYEKFSSSGGIDNWDPTKYLNIWVCNLGNSGGTLGYATFPSDLSTSPEEDGVVIGHEYFGTIGTVVSPYDGGRTTTHEIGHWLGMRHIWGDAFCGDDLISDTEPAESDNGGCPTFPHRANNSCGGGADGEMYMNYMDYVNDDCMNMFTFGQSQRMEEGINMQRSGLLSSNGCNLVSLNDFDFNPIEIYPNPGKGIINIKNISGEKEMNIVVYDLLGSIVYEGKFSGYELSLDLTDIKKGIYLMNLEIADRNIVEKIIIE